MAAARGTAQHMSALPRPKECPQAQAGAWGVKPGAFRSTDPANIALMEDDMKKIIVAAMVGGLLAIPAFAQDAQLHAEVQDTLRSKGVEVEVPDDLTDDQLAQLLAIANDDGMDEFEMTGEVEKMLEGM